MKLSAIIEDWDDDLLQRVRQIMRLGAGEGARAVRRRGADRRLHGLERHLRRGDHRIRGRICRSEPARLPGLHQGHQGGAATGDDRRVTKHGRDGPGLSKCPRDGSIGCHERWRHLARPPRPTHAAGGRYRRHHLFGPHDYQSLAGAPVGSR